MLCPSIKDIQEIIDELVKLQTKIKNIQNIPLCFSENKETDEKLLIIELLLIKIAGISLISPENKFPKVLATPALTSIILTAICSEQPDKAVWMLMQELPNFSMDKLKKLHDDEIPKLFADVSKVDIVYGSHFTKEWQNLQFIRENIKKQIEVKIKDAEATRWRENVKPIIDNIEQLLFPFWDYLKEQGSYGKYQNVILMPIIREGKLPALPEIIREFKRIKYKLEKESTALKTQNPTIGQKGNNARIDLTNTEQNILEVLGTDTLTGELLLKKAGYDYSSHYKTILSNLFKRGVLENVHGKGYRRSQV